MKNFVMYDEDHNKIDYAMLVTKNSDKIFRDKTVIALHYDSSSIISIAICQDSKRPKIDYPPFEFHHFSKNQFKAGIGEIRIKGHKIRIYYPEKTICDCFRYRTKLGMP